MAAIKPLSESSDKWVRRASVASPDYTLGIENPKEEWEAAAIKGENNYKAGVIAAANAGNYGKGIRKAGNAKWKNAALGKGPNRFAEGVALARPNWAAGFAPFHAAIDALTLPPRGPKGSAQNIQRVQVISNLMREVAQKQLAA